jgi:hypothetical protein
MQGVTPGEAIARIRNATPMRFRRKVVRARHAARLPTSGRRALPDALIIGAQRGGTSSLYKYLGAHPSVVASLRKETQYFSRNYYLGDAWYRAHFPLAAGRGLKRRRPATFEATPDYLLHPEAASRAYAVVPEAKIIVLLRDPVNRAFSQYQLGVKLGLESLSFEDAIEAEPSRLAPDLAAMAEDPMYDCRALIHFSYVSRGMYAEQLRRWLRYFPRDNFFVVKSEEFYADPASIYRDLLGFLGLPNWEPREFVNQSRPGGRADRIEMADGTKVALKRMFEADSRELVALLGNRFTWP